MGVNTFAQESPTTEEKFDKVWAYATLYKNENNPIFKKISFTGRFQADFARVSGEFDSGTQSPTGTDAEFTDATVRRLRLGFKFELFDNIVFHSEADFDPQTEDYYKRLTDTYIAWVSGKKFNLTVGKHGMPFTLDGSTSSKSLLTIDRNNLTNNLWFPVEYLPGISASGQLDNLKYHAGVYSTDSDAQEFGNFDLGQAYIASLGYDFSTMLGMDEAFLKFDYVYNEPREENSFSRQLENVASINFLMEKGKMGLRGDLSSGRGYNDQSDIWGFAIMPYYDYSDSIQLVGRYTYVRSDAPGDVRYSRYESKSFKARGDNYNEWYAGLNWYIYGQKLKFQTGLKYVNMNDSTGQNGGNYNGWDWTTAFRMSW